MIQKVDFMKFIRVLPFVFVAPAFAAVDVSATITELGTVTTAVISVGVAVLSIALGIKLYKWVKSAL